MKNLSERFWSKVDKTDTCWTWIGALNHNGYGHFRYNGKASRVHRVAFMEFNGTIPDGATVDHVCHNRACVRPEHLRLLTSKQNNENRGGANRNSSTGVRGVIYDKRRGLYFGRVTHERIDHFTGYFANVDDAEAAVIAKRNELFTHNDLDRQAA
jgi:hypothetical protein